MDSPFWYQMVYIFGAVVSLSVGAIIYRLIRRKKEKNNAG